MPRAVDAREERNRRLTLIALLAIVAGGALLRLYCLGLRGFNDEAARWTFASLDWVNFWKEIWRGELNMAFYYILLRGWMAFGDSEWILRSLSVLLGVAALPALYFLGRQLFGRQVGLVSCALLAAHTFHIRYSQEARGYSLLTLLVILSTYFFVRAIESADQKKFWAAYVITSALACYSHFFAFLVLIAQWLALGIAKLHEIGFRKILVVLLSFLLLTAPIAVFFISQRHTQVRVQLHWIPRPTRGALVGFLYFFTGDFGNIMLGFYTALAFFSLAPLRRRAANEPAAAQENWQIRLIASWLALPIALLMGASYFKPLFQTRYLLMCLPALMLLAAIGLVKLSRLSLPWRRIAVVLFIAMLALSLAGTRKQYRSAVLARSSYRPMTQYILAHSEKRDAIVFFPSPNYLPFRYYAHRQVAATENDSLPQIVFPAFTDVPPGEPVAPNKHDIRKAVADRTRAWVVLNSKNSSHQKFREQSGRAIDDALAAENFEVKERTKFPGQPRLIATLYVKKQPPVSPEAPVGESLEKPLR
ncbi:MAG: mannosyltransferase [Verrucomicrobiota bacterium]|jgi:4-amino-4-deoxy-L-arabinose transferase-like glycosyltransferase